MIGKFIQQVKDWVSEHRSEAILLGIILLIGSYLRLYEIGGYMTFLGDEGRDAIIVRRLLVDFDPILVGPGTSIGNMYLGPLYYYLIALPLLFAGFSPIGPSIMIALFGITTIFFVWLMIREWFPILEKSKTAKPIHFGALLGSFLYTISPTIIIYSRSSWNPNIMPFFSLLSIYSLSRVWVKYDYKWLLVAGISMAFVLQSHYLGLLLFPVLGVFWLVGLAKAIWKKKENESNKNEYTKHYIKYTWKSILAFLFLMSPLFIFDARHGWRNYEAMKIFFTHRQTTVNAKPWKALPNIMPIREEFLTRILAGYNENIGRFFSYFILIVMILIVVKIIFRKRFLRSLMSGALSIRESSYLNLAIWAAISFLGFGLYKQQLYDHYYGIIYAIPFVFIGAFSQDLINKKRNIGLMVALLFIVVLSRPSFANSPINYPPNRQLERSVVVAEKMIEEAKGERFNFAVIAERNYEGAYQYHLERVNADFVVIDAQQADDTITQQLFVVCEMPEELCDPTHNDKAEVANFGWTKIDTQWDVFGVTLYKLVHTQ